jgi:DNA-binding CsgD family transcriptional regulator
MFVVLLSRMVRLSEADARQMLEVVCEAAAVDGPAPFTEPVLDALRQLVPCDVVAYHERRGREGKEVIWTGEPRGSATSEVREASKRYRHQDLLPPVAGARKYSDFLTRREFHRLGLYREVAGPLGIEDMFRLWLDPRGRGDARLEFDRARRDFRERDRAVLDLLRPHLERFRRNAAARRRSMDKQGGRVERISPREREILELVAVGKTNAEIAKLLWISPGTVRKHLENAYEKLEVHTRTGAVAALRRSGHSLSHT